VNNKRSICTQQNAAEKCNILAFLLIKKTLRPNSIVEIIIKATGFFFLRKFQNRSIYTQQKVAEKWKIWAIFFLLKVFCGIFLLFCSPVQSFAVPCGPLRSFVVLCGI